jgi:hypothetical protein
MGPLAVVPDLEAEVDRLYRLPLEEFTSARNDLAQRLKRAGQKDAAADVQDLRKPTVPVWAINQIAHEYGKDVEALIEASDQLRAAQERALGGGDSDQLRSAASAEREALRKLTDSAQELLGRDAPAATLERVASTLRAAALAPETRALLRSGRLSEELKSAGFGAFEGMSVPARARPRPRPRKKTAARPSAAERRREERLAKLRDRLTKLRQEAADAEREAKHAQTAADRARARLERAAAAVEKAQAELEAAEDVSGATRP